MQKSEFDKCCRNSATPGRRCRNPARKFGQIPAEIFRILAILAGSYQSRPDSGHFGRKLGNIPGGIWSADDRMLSDSGADWISTTDNC
jgi:hypothetical protein